MPRHPRLFLRGATYHVHCRVARGEFVFDDDIEAVGFIDVLRRVRDLDGWTIYAWCLMGNHYHLVLKTRDIDLWRSMARLQGTVSRSFNRRHRILGRLWQSRYRARVIDTDEYFRQVIAYVHLNPVAAGVADDPVQYVHSGHREIIGWCNPHIVDRQAVLRCFDPVDHRNPADDYLHWVRSVAEAKWLDGDVTKLPWWIQANHVDEIADADRHPSATTFDGCELAEERAELELSEFALRFQSISGHVLAELSSRHRSTDQTRGRIEFSTLAVGRYGLRVCDVAALLNKHSTSVTKWLNKGLRLESDGPKFKRRLDKLDSSISRRT